MTHHRADRASVSSADGPLRRYVYGIVGGATPATLKCVPIGHAPGVVYTVREGGIGALVSASATAVYEPTRELLAVHDRVIAEAMREHPFVPLPFGTVLRSEDEVIELLRTNHVSFTRALQRVRDKIEFDVKVLWDRAVVIESIERESYQVRRLRKEVERRSGGPSFFARATLRTALESELRSTEDRLVSSITEELRAVAVASRSGTQVGEPMIMSARYLVERQEATRFHVLLGELSRRHAGMLTFHFSGPTPPHSFMNVQLELERAGTQLVARAGDR